MHLARLEPRGLSREEFQVAHAHLRQHSDGEEDDTHAAKPVGKRPPEEDAVRQVVNVGIDGRARGAEARHALEEGAGEARQVRAEKKRKGADNRKDHPRGGHNEVAVAPAHFVFSVSAKVFEQQGQHERHCRGNAKGCPLPLAVEQARGQTDEQQEYEQHKQRTKYLGYNLEIEHGDFSVPSLGNQKADDSAQGQPQGYQNGLSRLLERPKQVIRTEKADDFP